jgi:DNA-binding NarL/FixJ family response regulator
MSTRILLADDHAMLREGLRSKFADCNDMVVVGEAGSTAELLTVANQEQPQVILMDIKLPDGNGLSLIPQLKATLPSCKIIVLTMYDHIRYVVHALDSGADGFVVKGASFQELLQAIREVLSNKTYVSTSLAPQLASQIKGGKTSNPLNALSNREFDVLMRLCRGQSMKEMATDMMISEKTVTTYRTRLMEKLHVDSNAELIRYAVEARLID